MGPVDVVAKPPIRIATRAPAPESETLAMAPSDTEPGEAETVVTYASVGPVIPAAGEVCVLQTRIVSKQLSARCLAPRRIWLPSSVKEQTWVRALIFTACR